MSKRVYSPLKSVDTHTHSVTQCTVSTGHTHTGPSENQWKHRGAGRCHGCGSDSNDAESRWSHGHCQSLVQYLHCPPHFNLPTFSLRNTSRQITKPSALDMSDPIYGIYNQEFRNTCWYEWASWKLYENDFSSNEMKWSTVILSH